MSSSPVIASLVTTLPAGRLALDAGDLGYLTLGTIFLALGIIALLLTALRTASRDDSVFLFGAMSCLWGARFVLYTSLAPDLLGDDPAWLTLVSRALAYFSAAAVFGFAWAYLGSGWRGSLRWLAYVGLVFSGVATAIMIVVPDPGLLLPVFNVLVLCGVVTVVANALHQEQRGRRRVRGFIVGLCAAAAFFVLENLRALGIVTTAMDMEWIGVVILYVALGRLIAIRLFSNERRLAAIEQELATARRIQASLLPDRPPQLDGVAIAASYTPMTAVAGDIYDFVAVGERGLAVLVADVSGHGVPAALIASMAKGAFRAQSDRLDRPELVLAGMNRILAGQLDREFVTAGCAFVDLDAGIVRYAGAGHPPLLVQTDGEDTCRAVEPNGLMLGLFEEAEYGSEEWSVGAGERLVLYTDGLFEAQSEAGEDFGEESLQQLVSDQRPLPPDRAAATVMSAVSAWAGAAPGASLDDDLTLIVVDVEPAPA